MQQTSYTTTIGDHELQVTFTDLAHQAHGSVLVSIGDTMVLVTAVMSARTVSGLPYFPLSVEFEEKFYATGQILGSRFMRREGRPSDSAVLSGRIIDRTIRPLFNHHIRNEVQVVATVLSVGDHDPDVLSVIGASLALGVSHIPWDGPVAAVRIGRSSDTKQLIINPTYTERAKGSLDFEILACGKDGTINMIETAGNEIAETDIVAALTTASTIHTQLETFQKNIIAERGVQKHTVDSSTVSDEARALFEQHIAPQIPDILFSNRAGKAHLYELKESWLTQLKETIPDEDHGIAGAHFEAAVDAALHHGVIHEGKRPDGRGVTDIRSLYAQAGRVSPRLHGSGIFYRGDTHMFSALTLGGPDDSQLLDTIEENGTKKGFMHHYNFPPFSVGETGRVGGQNRRMIGHGALAEKALVPVLPPKETFPYTIRIVSETMASNGSSSMGAVCASTLALLDGGVPITKPVAGIASGLLMESPTTYTLITDIQGPEDEHGDMDFKVAGTRDGVTAMQMDVKVGGIPITILAEALEHARDARLRILDVIEAEIAAPRPDISPYAPKILVLTIRPDQIGLVIGSGGKTINSIKDTYGVDEITIEDDGTVFITGKGDAPQRALDHISALTRTFELGEYATVTITRIATFGAFAALNQHTEGLIHISEIVPWRLESVEGILKVGDVVPVVVSKIEDGKIGLSIKKANPNFATERGLTPPPTRA